MLNRIYLFKRLFIGAVFFAATLAMGGNAFAGPVLPDFTIDPNAFGFGGGGSAPTATTCPAGTAGAGTVTCVVADKIIGNYAEVLSATSATTWSADIVYTLGNFVAADGTNQLSGGETGLGDSAGYKMYALISVGGTFSCTSTQCDFIVDPLQGSAAQIWEDPSRNTTFTSPGTSTQPGTINAGTVNSVDDHLLGTATASSGQGHVINQASCDIQGGQDCGSFTLVFNPFVLTTGPGATGANFFVAPVPFYARFDTSGQFNSFGFGPTSTLNINGSADTVFSNSAVPEPATLTLLGLGLVGIARRRRATKA